MKKILLISALCFITVSLMAQITTVPAVISQPDPKAKGLMLFDYLKYDFGNLNEKGGRVFHKFVFTNTGNAPIRILNVSTSCGCTSSEWLRTVVLPGQKGYVNAAFEPNGKQGAFDKKLTIETNGVPTYIDLTIRGMVYASKYNFADTYKYQYGHLAVITNSINFPAIKNTGYDSAEIGFYNMSNKKIYLLKIEAPNNMIVSKPYDHLMPNTDIKIKLKYYPRNPVEYGPVKHEIKITTNDDSLPVKVFYVSANVVEDFSALDTKALKRAPKVSFNKTTIELGKIHLADKPTANFIITNKGKEDLIVRRVIVGCGCLIPELSNMVIPKGKSATLNIHYSLTNMAGPDSKTVKIITNDPTQSETTLTVSIDVIP
ncbi:MAG: DUF1573 domain-containing protein [Bacteroidia bacterium]|nr:DUF1573 domain-containing protein [Bacteroidia bacterium]